MIIKYTNGIPDRADEKIFLSTFSLTGATVSDEQFIELMCIASGIQPVTLAFCRGKVDIEEIVYTILFRHGDNPEVRRIVRRVFGLGQDTEDTAGW